MCKISLKLRALMSIFQPDKRVETKSSKKALINLYKTIRSEFVCIDLEVFITGNKDIKFDSWFNRIEINNTRKYDEGIRYLLENVPSVMIENQWRGLGITYLKHDHAKLSKIIKKKPAVYELFIEEIVKVIDFYNNNNIDSFNMILHKYEDTFNNVAMSVDELNDSSNLTPENKEIIKNIVNSFVDEFNSLKKVYGTVEKLDKKAVKESISKRLEDELEFVNRVKTDWNSGTL